jgi:hypothetical protein
MWILSGLACLGLGYAIVISLRREYSQERRRAGSHVLPSCEFGDTHSHAVGNEFKSVAFLSVPELRCTIEDFPDLLVLEVHESFHVPRESSIVPGALCISLYRLREVLDWVPPNEHVVLYGIGLSAENLIRFAAPQSRHIQLAFVRGESEAWDQLICTSAQTPARTLMIHDPRRTAYPGATYEPSNSRTYHQSGQKAS